MGYIVKNLYIRLFFIGFCSILLFGCRKKINVAITFSKEYFEIVENQTKQITPIVTKNDKQVDMPLKFSTHDENIAIVDHLGNVTARNVGQTKLEVITEDGLIKAQVIIEVIENIKSLTTYNITYHLDGGINNQDNLAEISSEHLPFSLYAPTKTGYVFEGWYYLNDFNSSLVLEITLEDDLEINLYAKWSKLTHTVTFDIAGTQMTFEVNDNTPITEFPTIPPQQGLVFVGWTVNGIDFNKEQKITETIHLVAKFREYKRAELSLNINKISGFVNNEALLNIIANDDKGKEVVLVSEIDSFTTIECRPLGSLEWINITDDILNSYSFILNDFKLELRIYYEDITDLKFNLAVKEKADSNLITSKDFILAQDVLPTIKEITSYADHTTVITKGIVTALDGFNAFLEDETAAIYLKIGSHDLFKDLLAIGNEVVVIGKLSNHNELIQIDDITNIHLLNTAVPLPNCIEIITLNIEELLNLQSRRVNIANLIVSNIHLANNDTYKIELSDNVNSIELIINNNLYKNTVFTELLSEIIIGQIIDISGASIIRMFEQPRLLITDVKQLKIGGIDSVFLSDYIADNLKIASVLKADLLLREKIVINQTTLNIEWTSSNDDLLSNQGIITRPPYGKEDGNVLLTAQIILNDLELSISFMITILAEEEPLPKTTIIETFVNFPTVSNEFHSGSFDGEQGIVWEYTNASANLEGYTIDGGGIMLAHQLGHLDGISSLSATITGGISSFSVKALQAHLGSYIRSLELLINNEVIEVFTLPENSQDITIFSVDNVNVTGEFTLELRIASKGRGLAPITINELTWTTN